MKPKVSDSLFFLLIILLFASAALFLVNLRSAPSFSYLSGGSSIKVVLDAGHGAPDGGAVGLSGTLEKDINLAIVLKLQEILEGRGAEVVLTRKGDSGIFDDDSATIRQKKISDMHNRLSIINNSGADLFISIHMNSFSDPSSSGLHVFYSRNHPEAEYAADAIQEKIAEVTGSKTHAVKTASESLFLMKEPVPPSILIECGFISNPDEEKLLNTDEYQSMIAYAIADAIMDGIISNDMVK